MDKEKARARNKKYYELHKDEIKERLKNGRKIWASHQPDIRKAKDPDRGRRYYAANRDKVLAKKRHLLRTPDQRRKEALKKGYGLTVADYDALFVKQDGKCALCGRIPNHRLRVDHNHETGVVRALL